MSQPPFGYLLPTQQASGAAGRELVSLIDLGARAEALGLEAISSLQATYAGTPAGLARHLDEYVAAGLERVVLRVADVGGRGLQAVAEAVQGIAAAAAA